MSSTAGSNNNCCTLHGDFKLIPHIKLQLLLLAALVAAWWQLPASERALVDQPIKYGAYVDASLNEWRDGYRKYEDPRYMRAINPHTFLQRERLQILFEILTIVCRIPGFEQRTWLNGGTMLGALRYDDFLPWDQDADVAVAVPVARDTETERRRAHARLRSAVQAAVARANKGSPDEPFLLLDPPPSQCMPFVVVHKFTGFHADVFAFADIAQGSADSGGTAMLTCLVLGGPPQGRPRWMPYIWIELPRDYVLPLHTGQRVRSLAVNIFVNVAENWVAQLFGSSNMTRNSSKDMWNSSHASS